MQIIGRIGFLPFRSPYSYQFYRFPNDKCKLSARVRRPLHSLCFLPIFLDLRSSFSQISFSGISSDLAHRIPWSRGVFVGRAMFLLFTFRTISPVLCGMSRYRVRRMKGSASYDAWRILAVPHARTPTPPSHPPTYFWNI